MILSNEPGYYKAGAYGIRIENLVLVSETDDRGRREADERVRDADLRADRPPPDRAAADDRRRDRLARRLSRRASRQSSRRSSPPRRAPGSKPPPGRSVLDPDRAQSKPIAQAAGSVHSDGGHPWRLLALLIGVTSVGPLSLNILAPAMPGLIVTLGAGAGTVQLTLSLFLLGMAVSQLVLGTLSDRFGRRPVMLAGLALTVVASFAALAATSITGMILARTAAGVRRDRRHRARPRDHPRPLRPRSRRLDDRLGHDGDGGRADDRAADRRHARHRVRLAGDLRLHGAVRRRRAGLGIVAAARDARGRDRRRLRALHRGARAACSPTARSSATRWSRRSTRRCSSPSSAARRTWSSPSCTAPRPNTASGSW